MCIGYREMVGFMIMDVRAKGIYKSVVDRGIHCFWKHRGIV